MEQSTVAGAETAAVGLRQLRAGTIDPKRPLTGILVVYSGVRIEHSKRDNGDLS